MSVTYMTRQQRAVLQCIAQAPDRCATAADLAHFLRQQGQSVGLTTVYRQLERLEKQGLVHKVVTDEGSFYQYCDAHVRGKDCFLIKCEKCGAIAHLDCSHLSELYAHLMEEHHFAVNSRRTLFYGLCERCRREESE